MRAVGASQVFTARGVNGLFTGPVIFFFFFLGSAPSSHQLSPILLLVHILVHAIFAICVIAL